MFKDFLSFWKGKDFLSKILEDFNLMGEDTEEMFRSVLKKLLESKEEPGLKDKIYSVDRKLAEAEKNFVDYTEQFKKVFIKIKNKYKIDVCATKKDSIAVDAGALYKPFKDLI